MTITELLESWKGRAEKAEAELQKAAALINTSRNEAAVSSVTCGQMRKELERVQAASARMRESLEKIAAFTNPDDENSYRADDREGCLDTVYSTAKSALANNAGTGYVRADDIIPALEAALVICQCFAEGQEASPGFMDNNENVLRIKDALAKTKGLT